MKIKVDNTEKETTGNIGNVYFFTDGSYGLKGIAGDIKAINEDIAKETVQRILFPSPQVKP
jgi:hypothetical protein